MWAFLSKLAGHGLANSEWLPIGIGAGSAAVVLMAARYLVRGTKKVEPPPTVDHKDYDPFARGSTSEQRLSARRTGNPIEILYALPENKDWPRNGWIFDRSVGGLGMIGDYEYSEGTILLVRPLNAPVTVPWIEVEVRCCRATPDRKGFHLGCKFLRTPPWSILLMFG